MADLNVFLTVGVNCYYSCTWLLSLNEKKKTCYGRVVIAASVLVVVQRWNIRIYRSDYETPLRHSLLLTSHWLLCIHFACQNGKRFCSLSCSDIILQ